MEKLLPGEKCIIKEKLLEPLTVSFERKKIVWKKKYKKYVGQDAMVLSLFGDDTVMLKMKNGKIVQFPLECIKRSEANSDDLNKDHELDGHMKNKLTPDTPVNDRSWEDELALNMSTRETLKHEKPKNLVTEGHTNQLIESNGGKSPKKKLDELYDVLDALNLSKYYKTLAREGFESLEYLKYAEFEDFMALGLKRGHARRLIRAMEDFRADPKYNFKIRNLQKRSSFCSSQTSTATSYSTVQSSNISLSSIPEYESDASDVENISLIDDLHTNSNESCGYKSEHETSRIPSRSGSASEWHSNARHEDGGYLVIPFTKGSLGFGFMSPFYCGTMVTSIMEKRLKMMGLKIGLPLVRINDNDITRCSAEEVASILACVGIPCTITFCLQPYFEAGEIDMTNNKWYQSVHEGMFRSLKEVSRWECSRLKDTVMYGGSKLKCRSTEKISDYNRSKPFGAVGDILQQSLLRERCKVSSQRLCSPEVGGNGNKPFEKRGENVQKQLGIFHRDFFDKQRPCNATDNTQSPGGKRGNAPIHRYKSKGTDKKMTTILRANLKGDVNTSIVSMTV